MVDPALILYVSSESIKKNCNGDEVNRVAWEMKTNVTPQQAAQTS